VINRGSNTRPGTPGDGRSYLGKAVEWLEAAEDADGRENHTATVGASVHAGTAAADAISCALLGARWSGEHAGAPSHVETAGTAEAKGCARQLRTLLPLKNQAEYDPKLIPAAMAAKALTAARRAVSNAQTVVSQLPSP
jgi:hypothetical protein